MAGLSRATAATAAAPSAASPTTSWPFSLTMVRSTERIAALSSTMTILRPLLAAIVGVFVVVLGQNAMAIPGCPPPRGKIPATTGIRRHPIAMPWSPPAATGGGEKFDEIVFVVPQVGALTQRSARRVVLDSKRWLASSATRPASRWASKASAEMMPRPSPRLT